MTYTIPSSLNLDLKTLQSIDLECLTVRLYDRSSGKPDVDSPHQLYLYTFLENNEDLSPYDALRITQELIGTGCARIDGEMGSLYELRLEGVALRGAENTDFEPVTLL